jgi:glutamate racemase
VYKFKEPTLFDTQLFPIGVFDSGVGGLSVLRAIRELIPSQPVIYLADQAHVPYGVRSLDEVRQFSHSITRYLISQNCRLIVVACNTASVAALSSLRKEFINVPFVGMEPAVKPAVEQTHSKVVGVLATYATFQGQMYTSVVERFGQGVNILQDHCPGLVAEIEKGNFNGAETERILRKALEPMIAQGVDTVVMGCTHYPFVIPLIQKITGPEVTVIDPAPAIARQVQRLLDSHGWLPVITAPTIVQFVTTGDVQNFSTLLPYFSNEPPEVQKVNWLGNSIN